MDLALGDGPQGASGSTESASPRRGRSGTVPSKRGAIQAWPQGLRLLLSVCHRREPGRASHSPCRSYLGIRCTPAPARRGGRACQVTGRGGTPRCGGTIPATHGGFSRVDHAGLGVAARCAVHPAGSLVGSAVRARSARGHGAYGFACASAQRVYRYRYQIPPL